MVTGGCRRTVLRAGARSREAAGRGPSPRTSVTVWRRGIIDARASPRGGRAHVRPGHLQRLGHSDAVVVARVLQPAELPPRNGVGGRAGHDHLRAAPVRLQCARARSDACAVRSRAAVPGRSDSGVRRRICARRAADTWRLPAHEHAAAVERDGVSAGGAVHARARAAGAGCNADRGPGASDVDAGSRRPRFTRRAGKGELRFWRDGRGASKWE